MGPDNPVAAVTDVPNGVNPPKATARASKTLVNVTTRDESSHQFWEAQKTEKFQINFTIPGLPASLPQQPNEPAVTRESSWLPARQSHPSWALYSKTRSRAR